MMPREHLAVLLGASEGRMSQMMRSLGDKWSLVCRRGKRGDVGYTMFAEGIRHVTYRDRAQFLTRQGSWSTTLTNGRRGTPLASRGSAPSSKPRSGPTPTARWSGSSPPPGPTGPTTGGIRPSPPTPWGISTPAAYTYRSTSNTNRALPENGSAGVSCLDHPRQVLLDHPASVARSLPRPCRIQLSVTLYGQRRQRP